MPTKTYKQRPGVAARCNIGCEWRRGLGCMRKTEAKPWGTYLGRQLVACGCNLQSSPMPNVPTTHKERVASERALLGF